MSLPGVVYITSFDAQSTKRAVMQFPDNAGPDQPAHDLGLRCPLKESMDIVVCVDKQRMPRSDRTVAHADLDRCCSHMT